MPMLFRTQVASSNIHGLGLIAREPVTKGSVFWQHDPLIDGWIDIKTAERNKYTAFIENVDYFFCYDRVLDLFIRHADTIIFINHSDTPNLSSPTKYIHIANKDIEVGEELTLNYCDICDDGWQTVEKINDRRS